MCFYGYKEDESMIKNKVLTPVLAGVLGVSVVGSGVGYYFVNKDGAKQQNAPTETMDSLKLSMTQAEKNVNNTVDEVQKAVAGQLDYAYDSNIKISFGEGLFGAGLSTGTTGGFSVGPIELDTKVKQKGQNSQADITAKYNDATIATLETIYARDTKTGYFRIPEISSAYISATEDELKKSFEDYANKYADKITKGSGVTTAPNGQTQKKNQLSLENFGIKAPELSAVDSEKLSKSLKEYYELFKSKLPAKKDGANAKGEIDGNAYDYKTVTYSITGAQMQDALNAVIDKMAADEQIKKFYDDAIAKSTNKTGTKTKSYAEFIAELKKGIAIKDADKAKTATLDIYYDGEEIVGGALSYDGKTIAKAVIINRNEVNAVDAFVSDNSGKTMFTAKGSAKLVDGTANGTYNITVTSDGSTKASVTVDLDKVVIKEDYFSGTVKISFNTAGANKAKSGAVTISGNCNKDSKDLKFTVDSDGKNMVTIEFKLNKTEATDVAVPTGKIFKLDQLEQYKATCDFETFKQNINNALGINIFGTLDKLGGMTNGKTTTGKTNKKATTSTEIDYEDMLEAFGDTYDA